jgi:hypothetical protein
MTKKQKQKIRDAKPSATARQQRTMRTITEFDPNGIEVTHHRTVDTLGLMLRSGAITGAMHAAGRDFQAAFTIACFDSMPRVNLNPHPGHRWRLWQAMGLPLQGLSQLVGEPAL